MQNGRLGFGGHFVFTADLVATPHHRFIAIAIRARVLGLVLIFAAVLTPIAAITVIEPAARPRVVGLAILQVSPRDGSSVFKPELGGNVLIAGLVRIIASRTVKTPPIAIAITAPG